MIDFDDIFTSLLSAAFIGGPFAAALLLGLLLPVALVGASLLTRQLSPSARMSWIFGLMIVGSVATVALSGRVLLSEAELAAHPFAGSAEETTRSSTLASQLTTALILLLAGAEIFNWVVRRSRFEGRTARLWAAMMVYFLFSIVVSGAFGTFRNPRLNDLYVPFVLTAVALLGSGCDTAMWGRVRWALLVPAVGSLIAAVVAPKLALAPDYYQSLIPGFSKRLWGLSSHANALGIFAAAALVLELSPMLRKRPNLLVALLQLTVLVLTQSKTAWIGTIIGVLLVRWFWVQESVFKGKKREMAMVAAVVACVALALIAIAIGVFSDSPRVIRLLDRIGAFTATGRTAIWQVTIDEFNANPWTGYGPSLWDLYYRFQHGMMQAGQAHNQFVQILGQAGLLGLLSMLFYLGTLLVYAMTHAAASKGWALVLVLMLLVRCLSESPLRMSTIIGSDWIHFAAFAAVAGAVAVATKTQPKPLAMHAHLWRGSV